MRIAKTAAIDQVREKNNIGLDPVVLPVYENMAQLGVTTGRLQIMSPT